MLFKILKFKLKLLIKIKINYIILNSKFLVQNFKWLRKLEIELQIIL